MKTILIGGGTGLVGRRLKEILNLKGYTVYVLSRSKKDDPKILFWDPNKQIIELEGVQPDIVINLTGAGIVDKRWSDERKEIIIKSRVESTRLFQVLIENKQISPKHYISASAIGIYGNRGDEMLSETSNKGDTHEFLVKCCALWEEAVLMLESKVDQLAILRIGVVLSTLGGALPQMTRPVKMGVAGYFGSGNQYLSWIHIDDLCNMILFLIETNAKSGVFNAVSPSPCSLKDFTKTLRSTYRKWAIVMPIPAIAIKLAMGEMSKVILNSNRVLPNAFKDLGYQFGFSELARAIHDLEKRQI